MKINFKFIDALKQMSGFSNHIILFLILLCSNTSALKSQEYSYQNFTMEDGLPSDIIYDIEIDKDGFLWIATDNGISKYDGYGFENFDVSDGIAANENINIYKDDLQNIWFIGYKSGLTVLSNNTLKPYRFNNILNRAGFDNSICVDFKVVNNAIFFSAKGKGVLKIIDENQYSLNEFNKSLNQLFYQIPNRDNLFVNLDNYNYQKRNYDLKFINSKFDLTGSYKITKNLHGRAQLKIDSHQFLFQANLFELIYFNGKECNKLLHTQGRIVNIIKIDDIIFVTTTKGYCKFPLKDINHIGEMKYYLKDKITTSVKKDLEGGLWVSTIGGGLNYYSGNKIIGITNQKLQSDFITTLHYNFPYLYTGSYNGGINRIDSNGNYTHFTIPNKSISSINSIKDSIYIAYYCDSIHRLVNDKMIKINSKLLIKDRQNFNESMSIKSYEKLNDSTLFLITEKSLFQLSNNKLIKVEIDPELTDDIEILNSHKNYYLIYSNGKLFLIDKIKFTVTDTKMNFKLKKLKLLKSFDDNSFLILDENNTLLKWDIMDNTFKSLNICNNCNIRDLDMDNDSILWVATNKGIKVYKHPFNEELLYKNEFDNRDGFLSKHIKNILVEKKSIFISSDLGIDIINKSDLLNNVNPPKNIFRGCSSRNSEKPLLTNYNMPIGYTNLNFHYSASSLSSQGDIEYKFRLNHENTTSNWKNTTERIVEYSNLTSGNYTFEFTSKNKNGFWNENPSEFNFFIPEMFFLSWHFKFIVFSIVLLVGYSILKSRMTFVRAEREFKKQLITDKNIHHLTALRAQMNPHFMFNSLNSIQAYVTNSDSEIASDFLGKFSKLMREVLETSKSPSIPLKRELKILRKYLDLEKDRFKNEFDYIIDMPPEVESQEITIPPLLLQPFVENSILHGFKNLDRKGLIKISFRLKDYVLNCTIEDNGVGRQEAKKHKEPHEMRKSLGMSITHSRVDLINEIEDINLTIDVFDLKGSGNRAHGTRVEIKFNIYKHEKFKL